MRQKVLPTRVAELTGTVHTVPDLGTIAGTTYTAALAVVQWPLHGLGKSLGGRERDKVVRKLRRSHCGKDYLCQCSASCGRRAELHIHPIETIAVSAPMKLAAACVIETRRIEVHAASHTIVHYRQLRHLY